jgi:hypothetical protein
MFRIGVSETAEGADRHRRGCDEGQIYLETGCFGFMAWSKNLSPYLKCPFTRYLVFDSLCEAFGDEGMPFDRVTEIEDMYIIGVAQQCAKVVPLIREQFEFVDVPVEHHDAKGLP